MELVQNIDSIHPDGFGHLNDEFDWVNKDLGHFFKLGNIGWDALTCLDVIGDQIDCFSNLSKSFLNVVKIELFEVSDSPAEITPDGLGILDAASHFIEANSGSNSFQQANHSLSDIDDIGT